eukprot:gnl/MRDRNA2_/MRDRNA2_200526_c0_seq1.p1 gnl/MRDRNA2_/MRDRNA2_200526_c0~~gnl/MRDRNA2_/MRDRNA2_200526_c0_seq1.p1  ORF type:complete len:253 (+),score=53.18 gnl/MRDRNA2_/MRDRNA2_200526_c0_seq1:30-761(+)
MSNNHFKNGWELLQDLGKTFGNFKNPWENLNDLISGLQAIEPEKSIRLNKPKSAIAAFGPIPLAKSGGPKDCTPLKEYAKSVKAKPYMVHEGWGAKDMLRNFIDICKGHASKVHKLVIPFTDMLQAPKNEINATNEMKKIMGILDIKYRCSGEESVLGLKDKYKMSGALGNYMPTLSNLVDVDGRGKQTGHLAHGVQIIKWFAKGGYTQTFEIPSHVKEEVFEKVSGWYPEIEGVSLMYDNQE